jgi:tetratricopeptide (TPR) repeat protein
MGMKLAIVGGLVGVLALGLAAMAWGGETPSTPAPGAPVPGTPAPKEDKTDKAAAGVKEQVALAEKLLKQCEEETAKPENKQDAKKIVNLKTSAAKAYLAAAMQAKRGAALFSKADEKQAFLDQYEKPNRDKAISILLELAEAAKAKKHYQEAIALYKEVLQIDPKNSAAESGLKATLEEIKAGNKTDTKSKTGSGTGTGGKGGVKPPVRH